MEEIVKIVIKGCSGFCQISEAYEDKVTLTEDSFSYEHKPVEESEINPSVNWKYKTSSIDFKVQFEKISKLAIKTLKKIFEYECTDVGELTTPHGKPWGFLLPSLACNRTSFSDFGIQV